MTLSNIILFISIIAVCNGFQSLKSIRNVHQTSSLSLSMNFESIREPVESYVGIWTPMFAEAKNMGVPDALIHWGHGGAMATVLLVMGGLAAFLGWQIRLGNGEGEYWFTLGKTAREQHPLIMSLATFFFLLGGQGGLVLLATQGKDILNSSHAQTAILGLTLLAIQAALPKLFNGDNSESARSAHAYLGSSTMVVLLVHMYNGINLGLSF